MAALRSLLIDTGPLVAYLNARDAAHNQVSACVDDLSAPLHTTNAVITEAMHLVAADSRGPGLLAEFVTAARVRVHDFAQPVELWDAASLMAKYSNVPADYADATLVLLADRIGALDILTLDRRGFSIYRTERRRAFRILPNS